MKVLRPISTSCLSSGPNTYGKEMTTATTKPKSTHKRFASLLLLVTIVALHSKLCTSSCTVQLRALTWECRYALKLQATRLCKCQNLTKRLWQHKAATTRLRYQDPLQKATVPISKCPRPEEWTSSKRSWRMLHVTMLTSRGVIRRTVTPDLVLSWPKNSHL